MNLLLDSHALLWAMHSPAKLSRTARESIQDSANPVFFSAASIWELAIKSGKGLLRLDVNFLKAVAEANFVELPVRSAHAWAVRSLPQLHGDPFDRLLVCQAQLDGLTLVTRDTFLADYRISILEA